MHRYWLELRLEVSQDAAEAWADACLEAGALSVQADDAEADSFAEQPRFGEPGACGTSPAHAFGWHRTRLAVLLEADAEPLDLIARAGANLGLAAPMITSIDRIADRDWVRATQAQFKPIPIGHRLIVVPSWHRDDAAHHASERLAVFIDPGLAFGTGSHPTTRMCLEWLDHLGQAGLTGRRVIDYGCGSGILAIAAARLGAAETIGIDIDPQALASAAENARANGCEIELRSSSDPLPSQADVVIANILSTPLKLLAPVLSSLVASGGQLALSGVLARQAEEVARCYDDALGLGTWRSIEGWSCLTGRRCLSRKR